VPAATSKFRIPSPKRIIRPAGRVCRCGRAERPYDHDGIPTENAALVAAKKRGGLAKNTRDQLALRWQKSPAPKSSVRQRKLAALRSPLNPRWVNQKSPSNGYHRPGWDGPGNTVKWVQVEIGQLMNLQQFDAWRTDRQILQILQARFHNQVQRSKIAAEATLDRPVIVANHTAEDFQIVGDVKRGD